MTRAGWENPGLLQKDTAVVAMEASVIHVLWHNQYLVHHISNYAPIRGDMGKGNPHKGSRWYEKQIHIGLNGRETFPACEET